MGDVAKLQIRIESLEAEAAKRRLDSLSKSGKKTERSIGGLSKAFRVASVAAAGFAAIQITRKMVDAADSFTRLHNQLRLVTDSTKDAERVFGKLFDVAQNTRSSIDSTVELYARLARSTKELGVTEEQLLTTTTAINQAFQISGATATEAQNAVIQLAQGMAAGALRGDEFRSVMEQAPRVVQALTAELGVTQGELRELANAGKLSSAQVTEAMINQAAVIQKEYGMMTRTVEQSMTQLQNDLQRAFSETDTTEVTKAIDDLRKTVSDPVFIANMQALATAVIQMFSVGAESVSAIVGGIGIVSDKVAAMSLSYTTDFKDMTKVGQAYTDNLAKIDELTVKIQKGVGGGVLGIGGTDEEDLAKMKHRRQELILQNLEYATSFNKVKEAKKAEAAASAVGGEVKLGGGDDSGDGTETELTNFDKLLAKYQEMADTAAMTREQRELYAIQTADLTEAQKGELETLLQIAHGKEREAAAIKEATAAKEHEAEVLQQKQEADARALEQLEYSLLSEEEKIMESYRRRETMIEENIVATEEKKTELILKLQADRDAKLAELQNKSTELQLSNYGGLFDTMASMSKQFAGEQSGIYKAMFAASKAFALAESIVKIQQGIASGASMPFPQNIAAMAQIAAQTASVVSAIQGTNLNMPSAGAFDAGGRIPAGQTGLVGEVGPELVSGPAQVTSRRQTADLMNGQEGGGGANIQIINTMDATSLAEQLGNTDEFAEQVMNVMNVANGERGEA
jgi:tape measure domain-containing protein